MKKILAIMIIGTSLLVSGCGNKLKTYEELDYNTLMNMFEEKKDFVLFIGSQECSHCDTYKGTLNEVIKKYQVKVYYIDIKTLSTKENNKLKLYVNYDGTPTTAFIKDGEETSRYDRIDGSQSVSKIVQKLKKQGYIK